MKRFTHIMTITFCSKWADEDSMVYSLGDIIVK